MVGDIFISDPFRGSLSFPGVGLVGLGALEGDVGPREVYGRRYVVLRTMRRKYGKIGSADGQHFLVG